MPLVRIFLVAKLSQILSHTTHDPQDFAGSHTHGSVLTNMSLD